MKEAWNDEDLELVRLLYPSTPTRQIALMVGRSESAVYQSARKLGLSKSEKYLASPDACRLRRGDEVGKEYRFPKGNVPYNKGLRRPGWAPGRMRETQFKPGQRTGIAVKNWRPIGTILKDTEGYFRIKVREGKKGEAYGFGNTKIWPLLHRHLWEQCHGPIPKGHIVVFKDRDRSKCKIENLELITMADNMRRNTVHNLPKELAEVIQLNGALKRKIRRICGEKQNAGSAQPSV